jgi:hypothetical protein
MIVDNNDRHQSCYSYHDCQNQTFSLKHIGARSSSYSISHLLSIIELNMETIRMRTSAFIENNSIKKSTVDTVSIARGNNDKMID